MDKEIFFLLDTNKYISLKNFGGDGELFMEIGERGNHDNSADARISIRELREFAMEINKFANEVEEG